ncbi:MAG: AI-2E family transporter [Bacillaceae bacterium]|nr:AI-2E family transporter [Bacillaceae bacterium]
MKSRLLYLLVIALLATAVLYMLLLINPILKGVWDLLKTIVIPFFTGVAIAYLLHPVVEKLNRRGVPRSVAVLLIYALFFLFMTVVLMNAIPVFIKQMKELGEHLPELTAIYQDWIREFQIHKYDFPQGIQQGLEQGIMQMEQGTSLLVSGLVDSFRDKLEYLFLFAIVPFVVFYLLKDMKTMQRLVLTFVPSRHRKKFTRLVGDVDHALGNYIRGQLMVCGVVGTLAYVGYLIIGIKYPLILASIIAVSNVIPYLGPFIGAAPAVLLALTISWKMTVSVVIVNILVQILEGNVVSPLIVGRTLHMHPLLIIFAVLVGGEMAGIPGMILAVPALAILKVITQHVFLYYVKH